MAADVLGPSSKRRRISFELGSYVVVNSPGEKYFGQVLDADHPYVKKSLPLYEVDHHGDDGTDSTFCVGNLIDHTIAYVNGSMMSCIRTSEDLGKFLSDAPDCLVSRLSQAAFAVGERIPFLPKYFRVVENKLGWPAQRLNPIVVSGVSLGKEDDALMGLFGVLTVKSVCKSSVVKYKSMEESKRLTVIPSEDVRTILKQADLQVARNHNFTVLYELLQHARNMDRKTVGEWSGGTQMSDFVRFPKIDSKPEDPLSEH